MKILRVIFLLSFLLDACTSTISPVPGPTPLPTKEVIVIPTENVISSTPEVILPLPTQISEAQPEKARAEVLALFENNNDCKLPCFWGITPGQTSWTEANNFLKGLSSQHSDASEEESFFYSGYYLPATDIYGPYDLHVELGTLNGIVQTISIRDFDVSNYHLSKFLIANGKPDEIWVFTNSVNPTGIDKIGFLVSLYYKEQQMIVTYGRGQATIGDEWLNGCMLSSPSIKIWAWDESLGFPETVFSNLNEMQTGWKNISEATQGTMDPERFYQSFSDPQTEPCFQTPKNIWPEP